MATAGTQPRPLGHRWSTQGAEAASPKWQRAESGAPLRRRALEPRKRHRDLTEQKFCRADPRTA